MDILPQLILNSLIAGAIYALVALGFNLIYGTVKFFDLGYGALAAAGGYAVFWLYKSLGVNLGLSILLALALTALLGVVVNSLVYAPLRRRRASSLVTLVASLGVLTALQAIIAILFTSQFQTLTARAGTQKVFEIFGGVITSVQLVIMLTGLAVMLGLAALLGYTRFGRAVRAVADDEEVAKIVGINTNRVIAAIIGGIGNVYGGVLGALLLGAVENFGIWKVSGEWKDAIAFGLLIIFLLFRPQGILRR